MISPVQIECGGETVNAFHRFICSAQSRVDVSVEERGHHFVKVLSLFGKHNHRYWFRVACAAPAPLSTNRHFRPRYQWRHQNSHIPVKCARINWTYLEGDNGTWRHTGMHLCLYEVQQRMYAQSHGSPLITGLTSIARFMLHEIMESAIMGRLDFFLNFAQRGHPSCCSDLLKFSWYKTSSSDINLGEGTRESTESLLDHRPSPHWSGAPHSSSGGKGLTHYHQPAVCGSRIFDHWWSTF